MASSDDIDVMTSMASKLDRLPPADTHRPPEKGWRPWVYLASGLGFKRALNPKGNLGRKKIIELLTVSQSTIFGKFGENEGRPGVCTI